MEQNKVENYTEEERADINEIAERQYRKMLAAGQYKDLLVKFGENGNCSISNLLYPRSSATSTERTIPFFFCNA